MMRELPRPPPRPTKRPSVRVNRQRRRVGCAHPTGGRRRSARRRRDIDRRSRALSSIAAGSVHRWRPRSSRCIDFTNPVTTLGSTPFRRPRPTSCSTPAASLRSKSCSSRSARPRIRRPRETRGQRWYTRGVSFNSGAGSFSVAVARCVDQQPVPVRHGHAADGDQLDDGRCAEALDVSTRDFVDKFDGVHSTSGFVLVLDRRSPAANGFVYTCAARRSSMVSQTTVPVGGAADSIISKNLVNKTSLELRERDNGLGKSAGSRLELPCSSRASSC